MIVLNVGAYKNGSTWLDFIARYLDENYFSPNTDVSGDTRTQKVNNIINNPQLLKKNYLFKHHYFVSDWNKCEDIYFDSNLYFINIIRSFEDVLVSRFFHEKNQSRFEGDFNTFFRENNKLFFEQYVKYHYFWTVAAPIDIKSRIRTFSYYEFKTNFLSHSQELAKFLGMSNYDCVKAQEKTTLPELRENHTKEWMKKFQKNNSDFYRKGIIGDHINYFTEDMYDEVEKLKKKDERYNKIINKLQYEDLKQSSRENAHQITT